MVNSELLEREVFLFSDPSPGWATLWIRNVADSGPVAIPCQLDHVRLVLKGMTYHVAAPGIVCALRPSSLGIEIELERPGGISLFWTLSRERVTAALSGLLCGLAAGEAYLS